MRETHASQLLDKLYALKEQIYYLSYPMKIYYIANPKAEPADYAEKVQYGHRRVMVLFSFVVFVCLCAWRVLVPRMRGAMTVSRRERKTLLSPRIS